MFLRDRVARTCTQARLIQGTMPGYFNFPDGSNLYGEFFPQTSCNRQLEDARRFGVQFVVARRPAHWYRPSVALRCLCVCAVSLALSDTVVAGRLRGELGCPGRQPA